MARGQAGNLAGGGAAAGDDGGSVAGGVWRDESLCWNDSFALAQHVHVLGLLLVFMLFVLSVALAPLVFFWVASSEAVRCTWRLP